MGKAIFICTLLVFNSALAVFCPARPSLIKEVQYDDFVYQQWRGNDFNEQSARDKKADTPYLNEYLSQVAIKIEVDPIKILENQLRFFPHGTLGRERYTAVMSGEVGKITLLSCIENHLFEAHLEKSPFGSMPVSEFVALMFRKNESEEFLIEISFGTEEGVGAGIEFLRARAKVLTSENWRYITNLHNHPFMLTNPTGDFGGSLVPSGEAQYGDISVYLSDSKNLKMQSASITNGFNTVTFNEDEILGPISKWRY